MSNRISGKWKLIHFSFFIYATVVLLSLNANGKTTRKIGLPGVKLTEAYIGTHGFVFPKAKTMSGIGDKSLTTIVANYVICELNYSLSEGKTDNQFLQHVFGVASSDESDPSGQNSLTKLSAELTDVNSKNPYLQLKSLIASDEKPTWKSYILFFDVKNSRYKKGILFFSIIEPQMNKDRYIETELAVGDIFLSY